MNLRESWNGSVPDDCPVLADVTYMVTLLGMIAAPAAVLCVVEFILMALFGETVRLETWVMNAGFAACAGAAIWSLRRCRGQKWNLPVQAVLAVIGAVAGMLFWRGADEAIEDTFAVLMFYPAVLAALHGLWSMRTHARKPQHD